MKATERAMRSLRDNRALMSSLKKIRPHKGIPEVWYDIDEDGDAHLVKLEDDLLFDLNEVGEMSPRHAQSFLFEQGLKAGMRIARKRLKKKISKTVKTSQGTEHTTYYEVMEVVEKL